MSSIITLPSVVMFNTFDLTLVRSSAIMRSRYTGRRQVLAMPYAVWEFQGTLTDMEPAQAAGWRSFLSQLDGVVNTFRLPVPGVSAPTSNYAGTTALVAGAGQTGTSLNVDGITPSTVYLRDGDYFTVNDELKIVNGDVTANGSGQATINFRPALRASPADNAPLSVNNPTVLLAASADDVAGWSVVPPVIHRIKLKASEAV